MSEEPPVFSGIPVKGCPFYTNACSGRYAPDGTGFLLEREPTNPYHGNAIKVLNDSGDMMGHVGREFADQIAPWMDKGWMFTATKTKKLFCWIIVTITPIKSKGQEKERDVHALFGLDRSDPLTIRDKELEEV